MSTPTSFTVFVENVLTEEEIVTAYAKWVLRTCGGNKTKAAKALGIDRRSLYRRLGLCLDKRENAAPTQKREMPWGTSEPLGGWQGALEPEND